MNTPGSIPPAAGLTGACVTGSIRTATRWSSWTFPTDPTPTSHERVSARRWELAALSADCNLVTAGSREHARENARRPAVRRGYRLDAGQDLAGAYRDVRC